MAAKERWCSYVQLEEAEAFGIIWHVASCYGGYVWSDRELLTFNWELKSHHGQSKLETNSTMNNSNPGAKQINTCMFLYYIAVTSYNHWILW